MTAIDKIARYILLSLVWGGAFFTAFTDIGWYGDGVFIPVIFFILAGIFSYKVNWQPTPGLDKLARYSGLGVMWVLTFILAMAESAYNGPRFTVFAIIAAIFATIGLFPRYHTDETAPQVAQSKRPARQDTSKRKNDEMSSLSPLDILTPEDLYELRQDIKDELRARILSGSDGELSSLDALLAEQNRKTAKK